MKDIVQNMLKRERVKRLESQNIKKGLNALLTTVSYNDLSHPTVKANLQALISKISPSTATPQPSELMSLLRGPPVSQMERTLTELTKTWKLDSVPEEKNDAVDTKALENAYAKKLQSELEKERQKHAKAMKQVKAAHNKQRLNAMNSDAAPSPLNVMRDTNTSSTRTPVRRIPKCLVCMEDDHDLYHCPSWCHVCGGNHRATNCPKSYKTMKCANCNGKHATEACLMKYTGVPDYISTIKDYRNRRERERFRKNQPQASTEGSTNNRKRSRSPSGHQTRDRNAPRDRNRPNPGTNSTAGDNANASALCPKAVTWLNQIVNLGDQH